MIYTNKKIARRESVFKLIYLANTIVTTCLKEQIFYQAKIINHYTNNEKVFHNSTIGYTTNFSGAKTRQPSTSAAARLITLGHRVCHTRRL
jgi:hypothetical protein